MLSEFWKKKQCLKERLDSLVSSFRLYHFLKKNDKINSLSIAIETNYLDWPKIHVSMDFSISIETFGTGRWWRDKIETSQLSRSNFWKCWDFLDRRDTIETNRDSQAYSLVSSFRLFPSLRGPASSSGATTPPSWRTTSSAPTMKPELTSDIIPTIWLPSTVGRNWPKLKGRITNRIL